ncbi:MAG TPA: PEP-CTERM sorting domain-containing protein, partial [Phenylobacterium sp.]|nr:PEP-CTERM sorting domain-containing protein [Phenylobacterium sp.]
MCGLRNFAATPALGLALALAGLGASPARAAYTITDSAGVVICCLATYDHTAITTGVGAFLQTDNAAYVHTTQNYDPAYGGVASVSTTNVTNLVAGGVSAFMPGLQGKYPILMPASGFASASSDLNTGQLHAFATSELADLTKVVLPPGAPPVQTILTDYYSIASADAQFATDFTTTNMTGKNYFLPVSWQVDGSFSGPALPLTLDSFLQMRADYNNYTSYSQGVLDYTIDNTGQIVTSSQVSDDFWSNSFSVVDLGGGRRRMTALFDIRPGQGIGNLAARLNIACWQGEVCDYGHTSSLSIGALPDGVSISFDAPGFLAGDATGGVPEPTAWALLMLGLGGAGAALRGRR